MNYICTWLCADQKGEESLFPQTGKLSSSQSHQNIYWRCILLFFITSKRFNKEEKHLLFTNVKSLPNVDGMSMKDMLDQLQVEVIHTDFKYKTPKGYYGSFQNQFYEFSILEYISHNAREAKDQYLVVDSDCIFIKPAAGMFSAAVPSGFLSYEDEVKPDYVINGLSRNDLKELYEELLGRPINEIPSYHLGEFLLSSAENIRKFYSDFTITWPLLLERHATGKKKFNEEAHTLSYLYFKNGFRAASDNKFMKRIWTNPLFYRNVSESDIDLVLWHLPSEKIFGLHKLYRLFTHQLDNFGWDLDYQAYSEIVYKTLGIPHLTWQGRMKYYTLSYYRAFKKRLVAKYI